jgi:endo-1,4-beta-xylanase
MNSKLSRGILLGCFILISFFKVNAQIATGKIKFLGNVLGNNMTNNTVPSNFATYWNQVTPENAGKWESVEGTRGVFNWGTLDVTYNYAKTKGYKFKQHTLVWGSQYPSWITSLSQADQKAEIIKWYAALAARYPNIDYIDVVNEPIKTACPFKDALGGNGASGWDWVIESFRLARQYFPNTKLLINEYGTENDPNVRVEYIKIINLLKAKGYIDGIGLQAHHFNLDYMNGPQMKITLDDYAATGLDVFVSELDIIGTNGSSSEASQLAQYKELFPVLWNHPSVKGITLWGDVEGKTWRAGTGVLNSDGTEKASLTWLKSFVSGTVNTPLTVTPSALTVAAGASSNPISVTTNTTWSVTNNQAWITTSATSGTNNGNFTINVAANTGASRSGIITVKAGNNTVNINVSQSGSVTNSLVVSPTTISVVATSTTNPITVTSNTTWTVLSDKTWINLSGTSGSNNGTFSIFVDPNGLSTARSGSVTVSGGGVTRTITVNQAGTQVTGSRTIVVRAKGVTGTENLELRVNNVNIKSFTPSTQYQDFSASAGAGTVSVHFVNDSGNLDAQIDYIQIDTKVLQAENQAINTAFYANGRCGGGSNSEIMHCNGYIEFAEAVTNTTVTITASAGANGTIAPGTVTIPKNSNQTYTITANSGYQVDNVLVNGASVGAVGSYTFSNVTANQTISATFKVIVVGGNNCLLARFGVPRGSALPTINAGFTKVHTLGTNAPNLSSVNNASINWALSSSSLWQLSVNIANGIPSYYVDLKSNVQNFGQAQPAITFSGTGIVNLDGNKYYANLVDSNNLVLVEVTGKHALYFSNSATAPAGCAAALISDNTPSSQLRAFPNPATNALNVDVTGEAADKQITVYNFSGRVVIQQDIKANAEEVAVDISKLPKGMYSITYKADGEVLTKTIMKQ